MTGREGGRGNENSLGILFALVGEQQLEAGKGKSLVKLAAPLPRPWACIRRVIVFDSKDTRARVIWDPERKKREENNDFEMLSFSASRPMMMMMMMIE